MAPPLSPWKAGWQRGAYLDQVTCRTPGPHCTPLTAVPGEPGASGGGGTGPAAVEAVPASVWWGSVEGTMATIRAKIASATSTGR